MSERFERAPQPIQPEQESENTEQPAAPEAELSPEAIERIMEKVQDINKKGTAWTLVSDTFPLPQLKTREAKLESILQNGIIGTSTKQEGLERSAFFNETGKSEYLDALKSRQETEVFFNIIGRSSNDRPGHYRRLDQYGYYFNKPSDSVGILFDLSRFRENETYPPNLLRRAEFTVNVDSPNLTPRDDSDKPMPYMETGFRLAPRIQPRSFKGVIFSINKENVSEEHTTKLKRAKLIAQDMLKVHKESDELLIPIYDIQGNLWWPKQMPYEEVKRFVAERDKEKPSDSPVDTPHPNPLPVEGEGDKM